MAGALCPLSATDIEFEVTNYAFIEYYQICSVIVQVNMNCVLSFRLYIKNSSQITDFLLRCFIWIFLL